MDVSVSGNDDSGRPRKKKVMRAATALTGVAAGIAVFAPGVARANVAQGQPPNDPYKIWVDIEGSANRLQVCGYKSVSGGGKWECTVVQHNPGASKNGAPTVDYMGSDWRRGSVRVWDWSASGTEFVHTCNTNDPASHPFWGVARSGNNGVTLTNPGGGALIARDTSAC
jgi:hypothetical protein